MPRVWVDGQAVDAQAGQSVLSVLQNAGHHTLRRSLSGEARGALCGMGVCFECRVRVDGAVVRSCQTPAAQGQQIETLTADQEERHD